ncbi:MAG: SPOR domain-containing protein [Ignavibacteriaceae bacterium]|jgi:cell division septation protein DedD|nr:SPOR domain-containing protein [Ignavibacteriaceae bacterium]MCW8817789.1 SPOR domain-containing protein [Ignavibacteriaceae bacterium]MCW8822848.1 SPOR domain-containing protein [Ignavibacteriaceae bacterium]MCW9095065.1 SPOR domain-containing protein [Ignavibacteriaceae bacterium]MCW9098020.1 SPOR domain-containing protein [Ignavibacteriaceae bacterium]
MKISCWEILIFSIATCIFTSCSSSSNEIKTKKKIIDSTYVFDKVPPENIYTFETPAKSPDTIYIIQIAAFSTLERAKEFSEFSRVKLEKDIKVEYNENKKLYVVQIYPYYNDKKKAETYRRELLNYEEYKDAWIVTTTVKNK